MSRNSVHDHLLSPSAQAEINATLSARFSHFAQTVAIWSGHPTAFLLAVLVIAVWIVTGPIFNYSDTWQLVINTGTTIVTFLMVFLIQNTQNRDMLAVQLKLSELVIAMKGAKNEIAAIEDLSDEELQQLHEESRARVEMLMQHIEHRGAHSGSNGHHKARNGRHRAKRTRQPPAK